MASFFRSGVAFIYLDIIRVQDYVYSVTDGDTDDYIHSDLA